MLPIWVGPVEANAIALQIENVAPPRPMTHDLLRNLLDRARRDAHARRHRRPARQHVLRVSRARRAGDDVLFVDARPSDALALVAADAAPVFVDTRVLDQAKSVDVSSDEADQERLQRWLESLDPDDMGYKM